MSGVSGEQCHAYSVSRSVRGGWNWRRHMRCRHKATRTVARDLPLRIGPRTWEIGVCGVHGKLHDEGRNVFMRLSES